jgi:uncharacterized protein (TIGR02266 family)
VRWWRVFLDKITGKHNDQEGVAPRRREAERFNYEARLSVKCASWPEVQELFTGDISAGGMYIPTTREAMVGDRIELSMQLPNGAPFPLAGTVVNVIDAEKAVEYRKPPGIGVQLDPMDDATAERFAQLLDAARGDQPVPEASTHEPNSPITKTGSIRVSAVRAALDAEPLAEAAPIAAPKPKPPIPTLVEKRAPQPIIGIDLGTTYTSVAAVIGKKVTILPWPDGTKSSPSVVAFPKAGEVVVGMEARKRLASDPARTVSSPKRLLGRKYEDKEIQSFIGQAPYRTIPGPDQSVVVEMWREQYAITQLCSYILNSAREMAEAHLGHTVEKCVVTCPVSFGEDRVRLLKRAGQMARLDVISLIDEPSAAALANRFDPSFGGIVGVYDFGGGTFDFSVVDVTRGDFRVLATAGDTWLGGDDFDTVIADAVANQFWRMHKVDLRTQTVEWQKLVFACERAKRLLSVDDEAMIFVPDVLRTAQGMVDLNISLNRETFERACAPTINRSLDTCMHALELLDMQPNELSTIYLSGGTTYVPAVRDAVKKRFGIPVRTGVPPEHAVCLGAAIHAAQMQFRARTTLDEKDV